MLENTTLDQIFDVLSLIRGESPESRYGLIDASNRAFLTTAKFYDIHRNTIADACTRRLQLDIEEFRRLVSKWLSGDPLELMKVLKGHTSEHYHAEIDSFFAKQNSH